MAVDNSVYDYVVYDSHTVEKPFALALVNDPDVKMFFKLPPKFKVDTPIGTYNPDWAVYVDVDGIKKLFDLRGSEKAKIHCGKEHFKAIGTGTELFGPLSDWNEFKVKHV